MIWILLLAMFAFGWLGGYGFGWRMHSEQTEMDAERRAAMRRHPSSTGEAGLRGQ